MRLTLSVLSGVRARLLVLALLVVLPVLAWRLVESRARGEAERDEAAESAIRIARLLTAPELARVFAELGLAVRSPEELSQFF